MFEFVRESILKRNDPGANPNIRRHRVNNDFCLISASRYNLRKALRDVLGLGDTKHALFFLYTHTHAQLRTYKLTNDTYICEYDHTHTHRQSHTLKKKAHLYLSLLGLNTNVNVSLAKSG